VEDFIREEKQSLRREYFSYAKTHRPLPMDEARLHLNIRRFFSEYINPSIWHRRKRRILIYHPYPSEPRVDFFTQDIKNTERYYPWFFSSGLYARSGQILHNINRMDYLLIPALFVTSEGYRLGRGGGFYDRVLRFFPRYRSLFAGYSWQVRDKLPLESHDRKVGFIITEENIRIT